MSFIWYYKKEYLKKIFVERFFFLVKYIVENWIDIIKMWLKVIKFGFLIMYREMIFFCCYEVMSMWEIIV